MNCVLLRASHIPILVFVFFGLARGAYLVDFSNMIQHRNNLANVKRDGKSLHYKSSVHQYRVIDSSNP